VFQKTEAFQYFCYLEVEYNARQDKWHQGTKKPAYERYMLFIEAMELVKK